MNITRAKLKETLRTIVNEESEYQSFFKSALEKAGKSIPSMSDEEKKAFFDKIDAAWDGRGEKNEALVGGQKELDVDSDGDIEADDLADLRAGKEVDEVKYPTDLKIGSVIKGQGFTRLKGIDGGKYYKIVDMDDTTATLTRTDPSGKVSSPTKVRHKLDSIEAGIKTSKRGDENGIVVIKESVNEGKKVFKVNPGIGKAKYSISSHDGVKKHKDGSDFFDIEIFKNKVDLEKAIKNYTSKGFVKESVNEAYSGIVGKTVFSDGKGKLFFGYYKEDDSVHFVDYKTWAKLSLKDVSKGDTNKDRVISSILKSQKQFNKKVDYNMWAKKTNPSFEEKMDWFIKNGWISNINKGGIKESINEEKPGLWANIRAKQARGEKPAHGNSDAHKDAVAAGKKINKEESVNEAPDTKKRFMFDFYTDSFQKNTERETNFMATTLESAIKAAEHICKVTGYGYVEIYYKDLFLGSMKKKDGFKFVEGRGYKKFNSTN